MDQQKRFLGIGGSDVAAILNISKFKTAVQVWDEKVNKILSQEPRPDDPATSLRYWGKAFEPAILEAYSVVTKHDIINGDSCGQMSHPDHPWLIANIDAFALTPEDGKIVVEAKMCARPVKGEWGDNYTDVIKMEYMCQVQHYMHVTGLKRADVAAMINGILRIYTVDYTESIINLIMPKLDEFWNHHVKKQIPPPVSNYNDVRLIYKNSVDEEIEANEKCLDAISKYVMRAAEKKKITEEQEKEKTIIAEFMGSNARLVADGTKLATFAQRKDGVRVFRVF